MKRVVMIAGPVQTIPPQKGAAVEWWMLQVCREFAQGKQIAPHIIAIAAPDQALHEEIDGVQVHRIRFGRAYRRVFQKITRLDPLSYSHRAAQLIRRIDAEIIHVHNAPELAADLRRKFAQKRVIFHAHNEFAVDRVPRESSLFAVSRSLASFYEGLGLPVAAVIPNGVDLAASQAALPAALPIPDQELRKIVLYAGRVSPEKGLLHLAQALRHLAQTHPDVLLVMVGEQRLGSAANDTRAAYTARVHQALAACPAHHVWLGSVPPTAMPAIYKAATLVVVPSVFAEPFGMVALEAMAAGACVLVAPRGGLIEFVRDGETGAHIAAAHADDIDGEQLAGQIAALLHDSDRRATLARCGQAAAIPFAWPETAANVRRAYQQLP